MRTETRTEQRVVTDTRTIYIADDGKEFESKTMCEEHERALKVAEYEKLISGLQIDDLNGVLPITNSDEWRDCDAQWYNVKDKNDYNTIYEYYELCSNIDYFYEPKSYPAIMGVLDYDDYADVYYIDNIIEQVKLFFNEFYMDVNIKERK